MGERPVKSYEPWGDATVTANAQTSKFSFQTVLRQRLPTANLELLKYIIKFRRD
jgi:hypothetical protein